jgi:hypothetical protein
LCCELKILVHFSLKKITHPAQRQEKKLYCRVHSLSCEQFSGLVFFILPLKLGGGQHLKSILLLPGAVGNFIPDRSKPMTFWSFDKGHRKEVLFHPFLIFFNLPWKLEGRQHLKSILLLIKECPVLEESLSQAGQNLHRHQ